MEFGNGIWERPRAELLHLRGYGFRDLHVPGLLHRPGANAGTLIIHFHDPVQARLDGRMLDLEPETLVVWTPGLEHLFGEGGRPWSHSWAWSESPWLEGWVAESGLPVESPIPLLAPGLTEKYLRLIHEEANWPIAPDPRILQSIFRSWGLEIGRERRGEGAWTGPRQRLQAVRSLIDRRWRETIRVAELAEAASLSPSHLSSLFVREFGMSPIAYQLRLRLQHAAHLLTDANLGIAQVAQSAGFEDPLYFSKQFRHHFGASPREYRRRLRPDSP